MYPSPSHIAAVPWASASALQSCPSLPPSHEAHTQLSRAADDIVLAAWHPAMKLAWVPHVAHAPFLPTSPAPHSASQHAAAPLQPRSWPAVASLIGWTAIQPSPHIRPCEVVATPVSRCVGRPVAASRARLGRWRLTTASAPQSSYARWVGHASSDDSLHVTPSGLNAYAPRRSWLWCALSCECISMCTPRGDVHRYGSSLSVPSPKILTPSRT